ncbi:hypothetical protein HU675_0013645 [Bradyrhizobium septentrionale]|uniref:hypothetical protein n=1 Tax=Bradyrhizobium septentrionale TaxID=1404411 RepID=UPI001F2A1619|nr:hypothetical protein [Bradyrhizobium septentrionale]UGY27712.1 hypothetical protein HU675_0013645 [Bradyrhizobium septentrionale]
MHRHRRIQQTETLQNRLAQAAVRLRQEATGTLPRIERERLIRRAQQADTASQMNEWLSSPGAELTGFKRAAAMLPWNEKPGHAGAGLIGYIFEVGQSIELTRIDPAVDAQSDSKRP